jgi:hypothetical protein
MRIFLPWTSSYIPRRLEKAKHALPTVQTEFIAGWWYGCVLGPDKGEAATTRPSRTITIPAVFSKWNNSSFRKQKALGS